jgi:hypothetical protein
VGGVLAAARAFAPGGHALTALLAAHVLAAGWLLAADWRRPFDGGKAIAEAIRTAPEAAAPVYLLDDMFFAYFGPPVSAYLGRDLIHVTAEKTFPGSFLSWDGDRMFYRGATLAALARVPAALPADGAPAWLITQQPLLVFPSGMTAARVPFDAAGINGDTPPEPRLYLVVREPETGPSCALPAPMEPPLGAGSTRQ